MLSTAKTTLLLTVKKLYILLQIVLGTLSVLITIATLYIFVNSIFHNLVNWNVRYKGKIVNIIFEYEGQDSSGSSQWYGYYTVSTKKQKYIARKIAKHSMKYKLGDEVIIMPKGNGEAKILSINNIVVDSRLGKMEYISLLFIITFLLFIFLFSRKFYLEKRYLFLNKKRNGIIVSKEYIEEKLINKWYYYYTISENQKFYNVKGIDSQFNIGDTVVFQPLKNNYANIIKKL